MDNKELKLMKRLSWGILFLFCILIGIIIFMSLGCSSCDDILKDKNIKNENLREALYLRCQCNEKAQSSKDCEIESNTCITIIQDQYCKSDKETERECRSFMLQRK